mgnify:FL=1
MGMFDYVKSSYNFGEEFKDTIFQTKDIEDGIGGTMTEYWIDPNGVLWYPNYKGTQDMVFYDEGHPKHKENALFNFEWIPTGAKGKYEFSSITKYVEIYPQDWKGEWEEWPRLKIHFKNGVVQDYERLR